MHVTFMYVYIIFTYARMFQGACIGIYIYIFKDICIIYIHISYHITIYKLYIYIHMLASPKKSSNVLPQLLVKLGDVNPSYINEPSQLSQRWGSILYTSLSGGFSPEFFMIFPLLTHFGQSHQPSLVPSGKRLHTYGQSPWL